MPLVPYCHPSLAVPSIVSGFVAPTVPYSTAY
jgi:hypothetical protein